MTNFLNLLLDTDATLYLTITLLILCTVWHFIDRDSDVPSFLLLILGSAILFTPSIPAIFGFIIILMSIFFFV